MRANSRRAVGWTAAMVVLTLGSTDTLLAREAHPVVRPATRTDTTQALRRMPQLPPMPKILGELFVQPLKRLPNRVDSPELDVGDPVLQGPSSDGTTTSTSTDFEGVGNVNGVLPPDPVGDIGPTHYVQMTNLSFAIWDRTGNQVYGPVDNNTLWQGFGGPCESTNDGDPIVLYDHLADRWLMSQFALPNGLRGPFYQCIAVSQTPDPTDAWYRYEFLISETKLNDYPKFGVWPDGYYMGVNQFKCNPIGRCNWAGQGVVAFERDVMLSGGAARMVYFDLENVDSNLGGMLPADLDGPEPPAGAPNPFAQIDDDAWGYSPDQLQIWNFHVDWSDPNSSTFTFDKALGGVAPFNSNMCGYSRNCIPQPGGTNVDAISDRLMYRLQYRNFGDHETLVVNHTVDADGNDRAGIRWYELRGPNWSVFQQGTYAPLEDGDHRWMGSIAMNGAGDIALGYSVSSETTYPSIAFTGRLATNDPGSMTVMEGVIKAGTGYQEHSSGRWGDYSMMAVDPVDDCTFWYTQEYYATAGPAPWQTRIGSFKLADCGPVDNPPSVTLTNPAEGATVSGTMVSITADATDDDGVTQVEFFVDGAGIHVDSDGSDGWSVSWDSTKYADGSHTVTATATDTSKQTASDSITVTVDNDNVNDPPTASFTTVCTDLTCDFDGSGSSDADGSIDGYDWEFGDGNIGSGVTVSHTYGADGTYTVTLTVTDDDGDTGSEMQQVNVSESTASGMHVGDLDGSSTNQGRNWTAMVTITVHDADETPLADANVSGFWSGGATGSTSCTTTGAVGACTVSQSGIHKRNSTVTFTVSGVTDGGPTYNSSDNHDPDGDSNGTSITVPKP